MIYIYWLEKAPFWSHHVKHIITFCVCLALLFKVRKRFRLNMSFGVAGLHSVRNKSQEKERKFDSFGLPDQLVDGLEKTSTKATHPLELTEKNWDANKEDMFYSMLRKTQGLHAPLKLQMEKHCAQQIGRLSCLASSNIMERVLTDTASDISPADVFGYRMDAEVIGQPHIMAEKDLGLM